MKKRNNRKGAKGRSLSIQPLESRCMMSRDDVAFSGVGSLSFSFAPDGTQVGQHESRLFEGLASLGPSSGWTGALAQALQKWATHANINFGITEDNGMASGTYGPTHGDERFGDIRITGFDYSTDTTAEAISELTRSVGTWSGDILFNTQVPWSSLRQFEGVALHEIGHVLGLKHSEDPNSPMHEHGGNSALELLAADIAALQLFHGARDPDPNDLGNGNNTIARASTIKGSDDDNTVAEGFSGTQTWVQFGDLTTASDVDVYEIRTALGYQGPLAVEVRTQGISLARLQAAITDRNGNVLTSGIVSGSFGGSLILSLPNTVSGGKYYLQIAAGSDPFWAVGDYAIAIATPDALQSNQQQRIDWTLSAHRWYQDSDQAEDGYSYHLYSNGNQQPNLDDENHTDDRHGSARRLTPALVTSSRTVYDFLGTILDLTDIDHLRVTAPRTFDGPMDLTVDIEPLLVGALVPEADILDRQGNVLQAETRVRGHGQYQIVLKNALPNEEYTLRVKSNATGNTNRTGNFSLTATFAAPTPSPEVRVQGTLTESHSVQDQTLHVARPQLFAVSLRGMSSTTPPEARIWLSIFDADEKLIAGLIAPIQELRTLPGVLLDPGTYQLRVAFEQGTSNPASVQFELTVDPTTLPIGPILGTTAVQPRFLCPGETEIYCYPNAPAPTPRTTNVGRPVSQPIPVPPTPIPPAPADLWFWQNQFLPTNPSNRFDANGDLQITPLDALVIINRLNRFGIGTYPPPPESIGYLDVNADGSITPTDVLWVINYLNQRNGQA